MTTSSTKPVTRESTAYVRDRGLRAVVVTLSHGIIELRAKGLRTRYAVDISSLYLRAVKEQVLRERAEKKAARAVRRKP